MGKFSSLIFLSAFIVLALLVAVGFSRKEPVYEPQPIGDPAARRRVHAHEGFYKDDLTPERIYRGILRETGAQIPNYPLHRKFYLVQEGGREIPLAFRDTSDGILGSLLGWRVEILGKFAYNKGVRRHELWVGYITPLAPPE